MLSAQCSTELVRCTALDRPRNDDGHEIVALARYGFCNSSQDLVFDLLSLRRVFPRDHRRSVFKLLDRDEHVQVSHV